MRKKVIISMSLILLVVGGLFIIQKKNQLNKNAEINFPANVLKSNISVEKTEIPVDSQGENKAEADLNPVEKEKPVKIPEKILIDVPFTSQAPFSKWDLYHEEACEEASLIMVKYFLDKKTLTPKIAEQEIQAMIAFEIKKYGDYKDSTAEGVAKLAQDFYKLKNLKVIYDFQEEDLKMYLAKEKPIIIPAAGRKLDNPNFTAPGPLYHNLVLIGYDGDMIITNDPGTRKGKGYTYNLHTLYQAIHDFPGQPENILQGRKAMLVLE
jgi:hypothetical protein